MAEPRVTLHLVETEKVMHSGKRSWERKEVSLPTYDVHLDGTKVGRIKRTMITREAPRARGSRISNGRWTSPGWVADGRLWHDQPSRVAALTLVLDGPLTGYVPDGRYEGSTDLHARVEARKAVVIKAAATIDTPTAVEAT